MISYFNIKSFRLLPVKTIAVMTVFLSVVGIISSGFREGKGGGKFDERKRDSVASVAAFMNVYKVLMSPRCMNCHPAGEVPLQGEDSHLHSMFPKRGVEGHGVYAMKCTNCHQPANSAGVHTPPGNPKWALPPSGMKMVFQHKTARELAIQIMDYNRNGHKNKEQLLEHARDTLVKWGWTPGEGRALPPLDYETFLHEWDTWIETGGYAPPKQ